MGEAAEVREECAMAGYGGFRRRGPALGDGLLIARDAGGRRGKEEIANRLPCTGLKKQTEDGPKEYG